MSRIKVEALAKLLASAAVAASAAEQYRSTAETQNTKSGQDKNTTIINNTYIYKTEVTQNINCTNGAKQDPKPPPCQDPPNNGATCVNQ